jgi:DNA repair exonuclease SbcCD ATPase subunit
LRSRYEELSNEITRLRSTGIDSILLQIKLKKTELKSLIDKYESFDVQKKIGLENIQRAAAYLTEVKHSIEYNNNQLIELTEKKKYLLEIKKIFSPTGIKAYIFNGIIEQLNQSIEQHLNRLTNGEIYFKILLDEQKGKYIDTLECQGKPRSVSSLSGGEHRKLSLAVDLALSDVVCSRVNYVPNILFLDEAFNGLDVTSKEIVMEVLTEMSKNKNIFVIDHSSEFKSQFTQVVKLIKQNGTTRKE